MGTLSRIKKQQEKEIAASKSLNIGRTPTSTPKQPAPTTTPTRLDPATHSTAFPTEPVFKPTETAQTPESQAPVEKTFLQKLTEIGLIPSKALAQSFEAATGITGVGGRLRTTEEVAQTTAGKIVGTTVPPLFAALTAATLIPPAATAVSELLTVGGLGTSVQTTLSDVPAFVVNTATEAATKTWLTKLAIHMTKPATAVTLAMVAIGSYPFTGFIKEEALQTLSFGVKTALESGNLEGAQIAIDEQNELLNPTFVKNIISAVPTLNIMNSLWDFFKAAKTKVAIDQQLVIDKKTQIETGQSDEEYWTQRDEQRDAQEKASIDYYNQQRIITEKELNRLKKEQALFDQELYQASRSTDRAAAKKLMQEEAAFWAKQQEENRRKEAEERIAIAKFWLEYKKRAQEIADNSRPSALTFGLL